MSETRGVEKGHEKAERAPAERRSRSPPDRKDQRPMAPIAEPNSEQFVVDREKVRRVILFRAHL